MLRPKKLEWKFGEEGTDGVLARNAKIMDELVRRLETCCANKFCQWPISALRQERFSLPEIGDVCAVCHAMHTALSNMNPQLKRPTYWKEVQEAWLKEIEDYKKKRKRMDDL